MSQNRRQAKRAMQADPTAYVQNIIAASRGRLNEYQARSVYERRLELLRDGRKVR